MNPQFAFLDRAISAISPQCGKELYQLLYKSSITYLSVGDHTHIEEYHDLILELFEDGTWKTRPSSKIAVPDSRPDLHVSTPVT